jgi:hypothetical protein
MITWNVTKTNRLKGHTVIMKILLAPLMINSWKIVQSIRHSDTEDTSDNKNPSYYFLKISHNPFPNIKFNNTSTKEIERIIKSIRVKNSHAYDRITTTMLKVSAPYISCPLNYICNKSIRSGSFPSCLKYRIVKPFFKKGDKENMLSLNADKTQYMQSVTKTSSLIDFHVMYKNKEMANTSNTKFLRLTLDNTFYWKDHVDTIVPKPSSPCFTVRAIKPFLSQESPRMVYFYFHSIMTYRLIFWGNSYHSNTVLKLQKKIIRIMVGIRDRDSCRKYFRKLKILPLQAQYIYIYF